MLKSIMVPLDGSGSSESILTLLRSWPQVELVLVRVADPYGSATLPEREEVLDQAEAYLEQVCSTLRQGEAQCEAKALSGDAAGELLACIEAVKPDLVAMSTHGRSGVDRWIRGSVAERVLRTTNTPLLLANPTALDDVQPLRTFERILVPLDGSPLADRILPLVESLARFCSAEVTLLGVRSPDEAPGDVDLEPQRARLEQAGVQVRVREGQGSPAEEIIRMARKSDLIAMTTHGRSGLSRWWFGSVAEQVVRHSDSPLLVWRPLEE